MYKIIFEKRHDSFRIPSFESEKAACFDMRYCGDEEIVLNPGDRFLVPLGCAVEIPEACELQLRPRSGLADKHGITLLNSPGTIDADYRGEIKACLINLGDDTFEVEPGMRVCQARLAELAPTVMEEATLALSETKRGEGGFSSTGLS